MIPGLDINGEGLGVVVRIPIPELGVFFHANVLVLEGEGEATVAISRHQRGGEGYVGSDKKAKASERAKKR